MKNYIGKSIKATIVDMTDDGRGVGKTEDNITVFSKGGIIGDTVEIKITKAKKSYLEGTLENIIENSEYRIESKCSISQICGGCDFQEVSYENQLKLKEKRVKDTLQKIGNIEIEVEKIIPSQNQNYYRNKSIFHISRRKEVKIGYYQKETNDVVDIVDCNISSKISLQVLSIMKQWITESKNKSLTHIMVRNSFKTGDTMVVLIAKDKKIKKTEKLKEMISALPEVKTIVLNVNEDRKSMLSKESRILLGEGYIHDYIGDMKFTISPETFFQINTLGIEELYSKGIEYLDIQKDDRVLDLYSGVGTISAMMSGKAKVVYGIEKVKKSVTDAKLNNVLNNIDNVEHYCGDVEIVLPKLLSKGKVPNKILLDPPRKGADKKILENILEVNPERIVYISCNPATLSRDLKILVEGGYLVEKVQPLDMFAQTGHVETIVLLRRR